MKTKEETSAPIAFQVRATYVKDRVIHAEYGSEADVDWLRAGRLRESKSKEDKALLEEMEDSPVGPPVKA